MDRNDRLQRQTDAGFQAGHQALSPLGAAFYTSTDRFRDVPVSTGSSTAARGFGGYGYGSGASDNTVNGAGAGSHPAGPASFQPAPGLQYTTDYGQSSQRVPQHQEQHRQQQQQYPQYQGNVLYNAPSQHQQTPHTPYDPVQPYQQRQPAVLEGLPTQYDVAQQYYASGESAAPGSAPPAPMAAQQVVHYPSMPYNTLQQNPVGRPETLSSAFAVATLPPAGMPTPSHFSGARAPSGAAEGSLGYAHAQQHQPAYAAQMAQAQGLASQPDHDDNYEAYSAQLMRTFQLVRDGHLSDAADSLLRISRWLLTNVEALGLVRDDETLHERRLKLWEEFNMCWLATLQKQKESILEVLRRSDASSSAGRPLHSYLINYDDLTGMGRELVQLCDGLEKHGLVDYQMGVWEEQIINILTACLDLLERLQRAAPGSRAHADHPAPAQSG